MHEFFTALLVFCIINDLNIISNDFKCITEIYNGFWCETHYKISSMSERIYLSDKIFLSHVNSELSPNENIYYKLFLLNKEKWNEICYLPKSIMNDPVKALNRINNMKVFL